MRLCSRRFAQAIRSASSSSNDAACPQPADVAVTFRSKILWITRSAPYCHRNSRSFANEGLRPIAVPVSRIAAIDVEPSPAADAIIFTSAHAVHSHPDDRRALGIPVFTLGHYAREAAQAAGYRLVRIALDAAELEDLVASTVPAGARLLIFTSREGGTTLADNSSWSRYELDWQPVYRTSTASDAELRPALEFLDEIDGIALYSPRGAERVRNLLNAQPSSGYATFFCLSQACADRLAASDRHLIRVADEPSERALHDIVHRTWRKSRGARASASRIEAPPTTRILETVAAR